MDLDLEIGTKIRVRGVLCEVVKSRKCSDCEVQKATSGSKSLKVLTCNAVKDVMAIRQILLVQKIFEKIKLTLFLSEFNDF
jgi:hypothetical protein